MRIAVLVATLTLAVFGTWLSSDLASVSSVSPTNEATPGGEPDDVIPQPR